MAVFTFSTKDAANPEHKTDIEEIKEYCTRNRLNFSAVVVDLLLKFKEEVVDESKR